MEFRILGESIIHVRASGYANLVDMIRSVDLTIRVIEESIPEHHRYIHIADYTSLDSASHAARKYFINAIGQRKRLSALIFCGLSPVMTLSVKLGKRIHRSHFNIFVTRNYEESAKLAVKLQSSHKPSVQGHKEQTPAVQPNAKSDQDRDYSPNIISQPDWHLQLDGFATRFEVIDDKILHSVSAGFVEEQHVDHITKLTEKVNASKGEADGFDYVISGVKELKGGSRKARKRYMDALKDWHAIEPLRIYIFYGANWFIRTASNLARPFLPFMIRVTRDLDEAFHLINQDQQKHSTVTTTQEFETHDENQSAGQQTQKYVNELLQYIGSINWDSGGFNVEQTIEPSHPFYQVFEGVRLIKGELDELLRERKQAERVIRESEEKYRTTLEANPDPVVVYDIEGKVVYFNPAFTRVFGWTLEERLGKKMDMFVPQENWPETKVMIKKISSGESLSGVETFRYTRRGDMIPVSISGAAYYDRDGNFVGSVINLRDIKVQKKLEAQLQQAQKMEALGTMAGGIAHDFNNLLMGIQGRTSLMMMEMNSSHPQFKDLKGIEEYSKHAADLTRQLLGFARGGKYEVKPADINVIIKESSEMFGRTKKEIAIHGKYQEDIWTIDVDRGQIEQVLLNLYVNAWQAMPGGGNLYIQTENVILDESELVGYEGRPGRHVKISLTDDGVGMDEPTRQRIFEPFFTTKELGRGTGLGLASAYGIIRNHKGRIDVSSVKSEGSVFTIYLPAREMEVAEEEITITQDIKTGTETVFLIDDEEMIIDVGKDMLEKLGYGVLTAKNGEEAIKTYEETQDKIDMVIMDMIMPDMGGRETYERLKQINSNIKVLLSSGYGISGQAQAILDRGCNGFIQKPFSLNELSKKIREILDNTKSV